MESDFIYVIPMGIFILALFIRQPVVEIRTKIKERRRYDRRSDRRMTRFRRLSCELDEATEENRENEDRRDVNMEKRRRDRRALERIKRV